jgi:hypothetical protein
MAHWRDVLSVYGEIVAAECGFGVFVPESKLPFSRETVKKALIEALNDPANKDEISKIQIELAFLCLDRFVPADRIPSGEAQGPLDPEYSRQFGRLQDRIIRLCGEFLRDCRSRKI